MISLRLGRVEILQIGLGEFVRAALIDHLVDHGNGKIGAQADRRVTRSVLSLPYWLPMLCTSASKVTSTSPMPCSTNVVIAARPPVSNTGTLANSLRTNSFAFS